MKNSTLPGVGASPLYTARAVAAPAPGPLAARPDESEVRRMLARVPPAELVAAHPRRGHWNELALRVLCGAGAFVLTVVALAVSDRVEIFGARPPSAPATAVRVVPANDTVIAPSDRAPTPPTPAAAIAPAPIFDRAIPRNLQTLLPLGNRPIRIPQNLPKPAPVRARKLSNLAPYDAHIRAAALQYDLPAALVRAVIAVESNGNPRAVSPDGAIGLMQLMPRTARRMGVSDPYDPRDNILGGVRLLRVFTDAFEGDAKRVLAAYNAGAGAVRKHGGIPPYEQTREYVQRVLSLYESCQQFPTEL